MSIQVYPRYALARERAPVTFSTIIVFSPSRHGFLRFDGSSWRESSRAMLASRGAQCDYQEVIRGDEWHRLVLDIDLTLGDQANSRMTVSEFRASLEKIIACAMEVFLFMFHGILKRSDFVVCESLDDHEPNRFGAHITIARMINNSKTAARFTDALICAIPDNLRALVDRSINSTQHNLRVIGCVKPGSVRVKKMSANDTLRDETEALVCAPAQHIICNNDTDDTSIDYPIPAKVGTEYVARACQLIDAKYGKGVHSFRDVSGSVISFDRCASSRCDICARVHDHDNTVVVIVSHDPDESVGETYREICRHGPCGSAIILEGPQKRDYVEIALAHAISKGNDDSVGSLSSKCSRSDVYEDSVMHPYPIARTVFVHAPMKLGKTKMLRKFVEDIEQDDDSLRVVILSFRRTFTRSIASAFPEFAQYTDTSGSLSFSKMIVQVESLHRIDPEQFGGPIDLLIMDESESIISQFDSGLSKSRTLDFAVFSWLTRSARICIALDAYMTNRTYGVIGRMRGWDDSVRVRNTYKNARADSWYFTQNVDFWLTIMMNCIDKHEHIVVCANSLMEGKTINDMIARRYESLPGNARKPIVKFYSSETLTSVKARDFREVDQCWTQCDILIYTPTLTAGVSFERTHFDSLFGFFTDRSCDAQTCIQMMGRVRNIATHRAYVCINGSRGNYPTTREDIILCLRVRKHMLFDEFIDVEYDEAGLPTIPDTDYANLHMHNIIMHNRSRNWFAREFIRMVVQTGAKVGELTLRVINDICGRHVANSTIKNISMEHSQTQSAVICARADAIASARDLTVEEYEKLHTMLSAPGADASDADRNAVSKFVLSMTYRVPTETIDSDFVMEYDDPCVICAFRNLSDVCGAMRECPAESRTMSRALEIMRKHEREHMRVVMPQGSAGDTEAIGEMNFAYVFEIHRIPHVILHAIGFDEGIFDRHMLERKYVDSRADSFARANHASLWQSVLFHFKIKRKRASKSRACPSDGQEVIDWLRQVLVSAYLMNLVLVGGNTYKLGHTDSFIICHDTYDISPAV